MRHRALLDSPASLWSAIALVFALIVLLVRIAAPNLFARMTAPAFGAADALATRVHSFTQSFSDAAQTATENEQLATENTTLAAENRTLSQKVADLTALAGATEPAALKGVLAGVVARPPESPYDTLVVAAGSDTGVQAGFEAFGGGGVPLGIVSSVSASFSRVTLFTASGERVDSWIGTSSQPVILSGTGAGTFSASVARSSGVAEGDVVSVPGPGRLPIGVVVRVDGDPSSPSVNLRIQPAADPFSVSWVILRDTGATFLTATSSAP